MPIPFMAAAQATKAFMTPRNIKIAIIAVFFTVLIICGVIAYKHIEGMRKDIGSLTVELTQTQGELKGATAKIDAQKQSIALIELKSKELAGWKEKQAQQDVRNRQRIDNLATELNNLRGISDPAEYSKAINVILLKRIKCIEVASGGEPLPKGEDCDVF